MEHIEPRSPTIISTPTLKEALSAERWYSRMVDEAVPLPRVIHDFCVSLRWGTAHAVFVEAQAEREPIEALDDE